MKTILRFHCDTCAGEDIEFHALVTHDPYHERFKILKVAQRFAFCKTCQQDRPLIQSQETIFGGEPETTESSKFNPMNQQGNL